MSNNPIFRMVINPGTYRDFAPYTANGCVDMVWFRSYHKYLKKIGGFLSIGYVSRYVNDKANSLSFAQPTFPHIQNMQTQSPASQNYANPFLANTKYQQYDVAIPNNLPAQVIEPSISSGGYGIIRKTISIIGDGRNTIISAGDAYRRQTGDLEYPVSGVCYSTNSIRNLRMVDFQPLAIPNYLPSVGNVIIPLSIKQSFNVTGDCSFITSNGQVFLALTNTGVLRNDSDGTLNWEATSLTTPMLCLAWYGLWLTGGYSGIYYSELGSIWTKAGGINTQVNALFGSLAGTVAGIYLTNDNGRNYTITNQTSGNFTCFGGLSSVVVAGRTDGAIYYSLDGKTWTVSNITTGATGAIKQIITANNTLYAISQSNGSSTTVYRSIDGRTWISCTFNSSSDFTFSCNYIGYNQAIFVLCASTGIYYSTDGITFVNGQNTDATYNAYSPNTGWLVASVDGIYTSIDGKTWFLDKSYRGAINFVAFLGKWFIAKQSNGIAYSNTQLSLIQDKTSEVSNIFTPDQYIWNLDAINLSTGEETVESATYIIAHPSCGLTESIDDPTNYYVYIRNLGELSSNTAVALRWNSDGTPATELKNWLVPMVEGQNINPRDTIDKKSGNIMNSTVKVSGGVCVVGPFLFAYGNEGLIRNSDANNPSAWFSLTDQQSVQRNSGLANDVNVGTSKIVKGLPFRGIGTMYAALFWSLDSLIMANFIGAPAVFNYTIISNAVTIIAPHSAIEVYGNYYWIGDNRFYVFAGGQIQEVPNELNRNWFFTSINPQRQHITWASLNPQFNEIWWFFPKDSSYECNHALIYNYTDQTWYDTPINRSAGFYSGVYRNPVWVDNVVNPNYNGYDYYLHEQGTDGVDYTGNTMPIISSFTTGDIGLTSSGQPALPKTPQGNLQNWTQIMRLEPDGIIRGEWQLNVIGRRWVRGIDEISTYTFNEATEHLDMKEQWRVMFMQFSNSSIGGDWYVGNNMLTAKIGDGEGI